MAASSAAQQQPDMNPNNADHQRDRKPTGLSGLGLSIVSAPVTVLTSAEKAAASGLGLVTHSTAAAVRLYVMALVWFAHFQLVLLLYTLLGASAAALATQQLALITGTAVSKPAADEVNRSTTAAAAGGATAGLGSSDTLATQQQQQAVLARSGSSTGLLQAQGNLSGQQQQQQGGSSLAVADSLSVMSGLWVGLGLKLWLLLSVQGPFTAGSIWLDAAGQGVHLSIAAAQAAAAYVLHAVRLLVQCSALLLAHSRLQLPAAAASALAAACSAGLYAADLARQVIGVWWSTVCTSAVAAVQALLQSAAQAVPGGAVLLQLLGSAAASATYAAQATAAAMHSLWRYYAAAGEEDWGGLSMGSIAGQVLAWVAAGAGWMALRALSAAEQVAALITARVLQGAHPMAQAAVYGSAGMLKRLMVEASQQSWLLLVQLYQAWQQQQQQ